MARSLVSEADKRRPDGQFDVAVKMPDGQTWWLPKPRVASILRDKKVVDSFDWGPEYDELHESFLKAIHDTQNDVENSDFFALHLQLGRFLLLHNYDLTDQELNSVNRWYFRDANEADIDRQTLILNIALGYAPKPSPVGDDTSSLPTG